MELQLRVTPWGINHKWRFPSAVVVGPGSVVLQCLVGTSCPRSVSLELVWELLPACAAG